MPKSPEITEEQRKKIEEWANSKSDKSAVLLIDEENTTGIEEDSGPSSSKADKTTKLKVSLHGTPMIFHKGKDDGVGKAASSKASKLEKWANSKSDKLDVLLIDEENAQSNDEDSNFVI